MFVFPIFQYITLSVAYSIAKPYRSPLWTNPYLVGNLVILYMCAIYINISPAGWLTVCASFVSHFIDVHFGFGAEQQLPAAGV